MNRLKGFTAVEIMVVVFVIGFLAGMTVLGYRQVSKSGHDAAVNADVSKVGAEILAFRGFENKMPNELDIAKMKLEISKDSFSSDGLSGKNLAYCFSDKDYSVVGISRNGKVFKYNPSTKNTDEASNVSLDNICSDINVDLGGIVWLYESGAWKEYISKS